MWLPILILLLLLLLLQVVRTYSIAKYGRDKAPCWGWAWAKAAALRVDQTSCLGEKWQFRATQAGPRLSPPGTTKPEIRDAGTT